MRERVDIPSDQVAVHSTEPLQQVIIPAQQLAEVHRTELGEVRRNLAQVLVLVVEVDKSLIEDHHPLERGMELEEELDYIVEVGGKGWGLQQVVEGNLMEEGLGLLVFARFSASGAIRGYISLPALFVDLRCLIGPLLGRGRRRVVVSE